jgi:hypothetical protein
MSSPFSPYDNQTLEIIKDIIPIERHNEEQENQEMAKRLKAKSIILTIMMYNRHNHQIMDYHITIILTCSQAHNP